MHLPVRHAKGLTGRPLGRKWVLPMATMCPTSKLPRTTVKLAAPSTSAHRSFRLLTWNILADGLAQHGDFVKVPPEILEWNHRMPLVLEEIQESGADVICIQELNHYDELRQQLEPLGYVGVFHAKHCSPAERYQCPADGLAIFHKTGRFKQIGPPQSSNFCDDAGNKQSQGYLKVRLQDHESGHELVVVTTHLKAKEGQVEDQLRARQMQQLLAHLSRAGVLPPSNSASNAAGVSNSSGSDMSGSAAGAGSSSASGAHHGPSARPAVIIAGDFNTTPNSRVCQDLKQHPGGLSSIWDVRPRRAAAATAGCSSSTGSSDQPGAAEAAAVAAAARGGSDQSSTFTAPSLDDAADAMFFPGGSAAEFSTWKFRSKGESKRIIDHVWFTSATSMSAAASAAVCANGNGNGTSHANGNGNGKPPPASAATAGEGCWLQAASRWRMLTEEEIGPGALPCRGYASDHMSVCVEFEWAQV